MQRIPHAMQSRTAQSRALIKDCLKQQHQQSRQSNLLNFSSEDLANKNYINDTLHDVAAFKQNLVLLRRLLQEVSVVSD